MSCKAWNGRTSGLNNIMRAAGKSIAINSSAVATPLRNCLPSSALGSCQSSSGPVAAVDERRN